MHKSGQLVWFIASDLFWFRLTQVICHEGLTLKFAAFGTVL